MLYVGDKDGSRLIKGPHGNRAGIAIHGWNPRFSQGCFTTFANSSNGNIQALIDAIPDFNDSTQPVRLIVEPRKAETIIKDKQILWKGSY